MAKCNIILLMLSFTEKQIVCLISCLSDTEIKDEFLAQLTSSQSSVIRVVFATIAMGLGVNISNIRQIIHITPPRTMVAYYQEIGHVGRDGLPSKATLYYNNSDIVANIEIYKATAEFCKSSDKCLHTQLLGQSDTSPKNSIMNKHACCQVCQKSCKMG